MIICPCFGTTDRDIRAAYGPDGNRQCRAGQGCGGCLPLVQAITSQVDAPRQPVTRPDERPPQVPRTERP